MGKRSNFERRPRDAYFTPYEAVIPLLPHLCPQTQFIEPCAGDGRLIKHLERHGHECVYACDIEPLAEGIENRDVLFFDQGFRPCNEIITNPPWLREPLHQMIDLFSSHSSTWLLFDAGWMFTGQASWYLENRCAKIVTVGRVKWIEGSENGGMEDACWYNFVNFKCATRFYGKK
jgi:hypothetical protein